MTVSQEFVTEKLSAMDQYRGELAGLLASTNQEIVASPALRHGIERLFQLLVDTMVDINRHLIGELELPVPNDLFSTFTILGQHRILDAAFATKLAPIIGVRNRLVHQYEEIDQALFLANLRMHSGDFQRYQEQISAYLKTIGPDTVPRV